ncbi:MAG: hypothetical protein LC775_14160, partial [Acidobacteria bacterium]|nr:hypothetical protein [Acidobacteriota bacterium]
MNCRKIRREIEEARPGKWLGSDVNEHVSNCVACETLLREQTKLRELVSSLGTIEAPSDFNFRLRARLAEEKRARTQPFRLGSFSWGLRSAAAATLVLLVGSGLMFVNFSTLPDDASSGEVAATLPNNPESGAGAKTVAATGREVTAPENKGSINNRTVKSSSQPSKRRHGLRQVQIAARRDVNNVSTRDLSSTPASVLRRDQLAGVYPASAFPIDGGYQSLKVSLDNGR